MLLDKLLEKFGFNLNKRVGNRKSKLLASQVIEFLGCFEVIHIKAHYLVRMGKHPLTLLTNAVIAYKTWKLHKVLERRKATGKSVPINEILAHVAPIAFRHICYHGVYRFPLERYLERPLPSAPPPAIAVGAV